MSLRIATGTDGSVKERKGLKRKFAAYAGLAFGLIDRKSTRLNSSHP